MRTFTYNDNLYDKKYSSQRIFCGREYLFDERLMARQLQANRKAIAAPKATPYNK